MSVSSNELNYIGGARAINSLRNRFVGGNKPIPEEERRNEKDAVGILE